MMTRGKYVAALLGGALAFALVVFTPGCTDECVDRFDCVGKGASGEFLVCDEGRCLPGTKPTPEDAGTGDDAGVEDAGMDDGGVTDGGMDAGMEDAGMDAGMEDAGMDAGAEVTYVANLSGAQEVPPVTTTATGTGTCVLSAAEDSLDCTVTLSAGLIPTSAHIHEAHAGLSGGVLKGFTTPLPVTFSETFAMTASDVTSLQQGRLYVNVHSTAHSAGEIRGQLLLPNEKLYAAQIDGGTEGSGAAGFIVNAAGDTMTYEVTLNDASGVTAAHIHDKADDSVLIGLANVGDDGGFGTVAVTSDQLDVLDNDGGYLNIHGAADAVIITGDVYKLQ